MLQAARRLSLAVVVLACVGVVLFVGVGTLFFDDPHASYPQFLLGFGVKPIVVLVAAELGSRALSRWAERRGWHGAAIATALLPIALVLGSAVRIVALTE